MIWSEDIVRHEAKIRRQAKMIGFFWGIVLMIIGSIFIDMTLDILRK